MTARIRLARALALTAFVGFLLAGCGSDAKPATKSNSATASDSDSEAPDSSESAASASGKPLPRPLSDIEAAAEDIIDEIPNRAWTSIVADASDMRDSWAQYKPQAAADGAAQSRVDTLGAALDRLNASAAAQDGPGTAQAANDVSRELVELFALYDVGHPVQIGRLDVIGRQIIIDVDAGNLGDASQQVDRAVTEWNAISKEIADRSQKVASDAENSLDVLKVAAAQNDTTTLVSQAKVLLEVVDDMERLY